MIGTVAAMIPAFFVSPVRVGTEQHAAGLQCGTQLPQHARQLLGRNMKQRGVGEYAVEAPVRQIELEKILLPDFASGFRPRHFGEALRALQPNRKMAETGKAAPAVIFKPGDDVRDFRAG